MACNKEACRRLVAAASRALPQAKRKLLQRTYRSECQAAAKRERREDRSGAEKHPCWLDLPQDLLARVLDALDPFALASAGLACRAWQRETHKEHRWQRFCQACEVRPNAKDWHKMWRSLASGADVTWSPAAERVNTHLSAETRCAAGERVIALGVLKWSSNRVMEHGRLAWVEPSCQLDEMPRQYHPDVRRVSTVGALMFVVHARQRRIAKTPAAVAGGCIHHGGPCLIQRQQLRLRG